MHRFIYNIGLTKVVPFYFYQDPLTETLHLLDFLYQ